MYWQTEKLRKGATWASGGTYRLDLPANGLLSAIMLHAYGTPVVDSMLTAEKWRLWDYISKIEVIANGSTVLKSLTGRVAKFYSWFNGGIASPDKPFNYGTSTHRFHNCLNFGRYLFDPMFGLDLSRYNSVELQLTNDASGTYYTGDWSVDVDLVYMRDVPGAPFQGFFRTEEWRKWTTVQAAWQYLELPTEYNIRDVVLQVEPERTTKANADTTPYNVAYVVQCLLKTGLLKVFDGNLRDLWYLNAWDHGRDIIQGIEPYHSDTYGVVTGVGQSLGAAGLRLEHSGDQSTYGTTLLPGEDSDTLQREANSDSDQDSLLVLGLALEDCAYLRFNTPDEPASYLNPAEQQTVQLNIQTRDASSAANGTIRVMLDRLVKY